MRSISYFSTFSPTFLSFHGFSLLLIKKEGEFYCHREILKNPDKKPFNNEYNPRFNQIPWPASKQTQGFENS
jgi:hypothetical protein